MLSKLTRLRKTGVRSFSFVLIASLLASQLAFMAPVFALDSTLSGTVTSGQSSTPIENATVEVINPSTSGVVGSDTTDASGTYSVIVTVDTSTVFNVRVTPPPSSGLQVTTVNSVNLSSNQILNVALLGIPPDPQTYTYSGTLRNEQNAPLSGFRVLLSGPGSRVATTNAQGQFTMTAPTGLYRLEVEVGDSFGLKLSGPQNINLNTNIIQDITIPVAKLTVNVVKPDGSPAGGAYEINGELTQTIDEESMQVELFPGYTATNLGDSLQLEDHPPESPPNVFGNVLEFYVVTGHTINSLSITSVPYPLQNLHMSNLAAISQDTTITAQLQTAPQDFTYSGTLRDAQNNPLPGYRVSLSGTASRGATTNAQGQFSIPAPAGQYRLTVELQAFDFRLEGPQNINHSSNTTQDITLPVARLSVNVLEPDGSPAGGAYEINGELTQTIEEESMQVELFPGYAATNFGDTLQLQDRPQEGPPNFFGNVLEYHVVVGHTISSLSITSVPYPLQNLHLNNIAAITQDTTITAQLQTAPQNFTYSGTLRDEQNNPVPGQLVRLTGGVGGQATTNDQGQFTITAQNGQHGLQIVVGGNFGIEFSGPQNINLSSNMVQDITIPIAKLSVNVVKPDGNPAGGDYEITGVLTQTIPEENPMQFELFPGYTVSGYGDNQVQDRPPEGPPNFFGNVLEFYVLTGRTINSLSVTGLPSQYQNFVLNNLTPITQNTSLTVQLQQIPLPAAPQNLSGVSPTNQYPVLSWTASPNATSYKVYRGGNLVGTTTTTQFTDNTVTTSDHYTYNVEACNAAGCTMSSGFPIIYDIEGPTMNTPQWQNNPTVEGQNAVVTALASTQFAPGAGGEYFIGTDPGQGNGIPMTYVDGQVTASIGANLAPGTYTINIRAFDTLGNWGAPVQTQLIVLPGDATAPTITPNFTQMPGLGGWNKAPFVLTWTVADPESAITNQTGCDPVSVDAETAGTTVTCSATSTGGTASQSVVLKLDMTSPVLGAPTWSANPLALGGSTSFTMGATDTLSGVTGGEYFIGTDPGVGSATALTWNGTALASGNFGPNLAAGVYPVGVRAQDVAGNWSMTETLYLVVFDPAAPTQVLGQNRLAPVFGSDVLPGLTNDPQQNDRVDFGFDVRLLANGQVDTTSDFSFNYETGKKCNSPNPENCHETSFTASGFSWLTINGTNNATGTFQGTGTLVIDGVTTTNPFRVVGVDAELLGSGTDDVHILVYAVGADPNTAQPIYHVHRSPTGQGVVIQ